MNLREFIAYNSHCPICSSKVTFALHSKKRQTIRYENDRLIVLFPLDSLKKNQADFKVGYSFGLDDNSLCIEFYSKDEKRMEDRTPMFLIDRFRELNKNLGFYRFYKICPCENYGCRTQDFSLESIKDIPSINLIREFWIFHYNDNNGKDKIIELINQYDEKESEVIFRLKSIYDYEIENGKNSFTVPLIPFVSVEETPRRLRNLLPFS